MELKDHPAGTIEELAEFTQQLCKKIGLPRVRVSCSQINDKRQGSYSPITREIIFYSRIFSEDSFNDYRRRAIAAHELAHHYIWERMYNQRKRAHGKEFTNKEKEFLALLDMQPLRSKGIVSGYLRALARGSQILWTAPGYIVKNGIVYPDISFPTLCLPVQHYHKKKNIRKIRFWLPNTGQTSVSDLPYNVCSETWIPQTWFIRFKLSNYNPRELFPKGITQIIYQKEGNSWIEEGSHTTEQPQTPAPAEEKEPAQVVIGQLTLF